MRVHQTANWLSAPERILVIRIDGIGDLLCATPCLHSLRKAFPRAKIDFLANLGPHQVLQGNKDLDELLIDYRTKVSGSRLKGLLHLPRRLLRIIRWRLIGYDLVVVAHYGIHHRAIQLAQSVRCKRILVNVEPQFHEEIQDKRVVFSNYQSEQHEVVGVHAVINRLVLTSPGRMWLSAVPMATNTKRVIGINISASAPERQWPLGKFKALSDHITEKHTEAKVIITGTKVDIQDFKMLWANQKTCPEVLKTPSLWSYINAVNQCDVYISSDGGGVHIASALGKAQVALFQNLKAKFLRWRPWQVPNRTITAALDNAPVGAISLDQVTEAVDQLIETLNGRNNSATAASKT